MPTIIDSLIIELGIDATKLSAQQKAALDRAKAEAAEGGKQIERSAKSASDAIDKVTKSVLTLFAVFVGARGIKDFASDVTQADAALGRLARNLDTSPQVLAGWQMAAERMGGSAAATASTFERVSKALYDLHQNGQMLPKEFGQLQAKTGAFIDTDHGTVKYLLDVATALHQLAAVDPQQAHFLAQGIGIDDATANAMIKYGSGFSAYIKDVSKYAPSDATIKAMQDLIDQMAALQQQVTAFGAGLLGDLEPEITSLLKQFSNWLAEPGTLKEFENDAKSLMAQLPAMASDLTQIAGAANQVANAFGGWGKVLEGLIALWATSKAMSFFTGIRALLGLAAGTAVASGGATGAAAGGGVAAAGGGALAAVGTVGALALGAWLGSAGPAGGDDSTLVNQYNSMYAWWHNKPAGRGNTSDMIRQSAIAHGIDPNVALKVWANEGRAGYNGDQGSSFGPFQLHYGGVSSQFPHPGLGDEFTKQTGLNARDQSTIKQQIDFAMQWVSQNGWGAWSGARMAGIVGKMGVGPVPLAPVNGFAGAIAAGSMLKWAGLSNIQNSHSVTTSHSSNEMHISNLNVTTQAKDAEGIGSSIGGALRRTAMLSMANTGLA